MSIVVAAREFAIEAHGPQMYGARPYVVHLDEVAAIVERYGDTHRIVAYLHDVLEDTVAGASLIWAGFGIEIMIAVESVTDPSGGTSRAMRKGALCARLERLDAIRDALALRVKAADRLANVRASTLEGKVGLVTMYRSEHEALRRACFRPGLCDEIWLELDELLRDL